MTSEHYMIEAQLILKCAAEEVFQFKHKHFLRETLILSSINIVYIIDII